MQTMLREQKQIRYRKKILGIIVARAGSKGVKNKNVRVLCGKPLIVYTIEVAKRSKFLDRFIVSTDGDEIARIAREHGAEVPFKRPAELATDTAHTPSVILHALEWLEKNEGYVPDGVFVLQPTSPLRTARHIDHAIELFQKGEFDSVVSVAPAFPIWWLVKVEGEKMVPYVKLPDDENAYNLERQQLPPTFKINGAAYLVDINYLKKSGSIINPKNCGAIIMDEEPSLDIDTEEDFLTIEGLLKKRMMK